MSQEKIYKKLNFLLDVEKLSQVSRSEAIKRLSPAITKQRYYQILESGDVPSKGTMEFIRKAFNLEADLYYNIVKHHFLNHHKYGRKKSTSV